MEPGWVEALVVGPACHLPLPMGAQWCLKCCLFRGPLYPIEALNWASDFPLEDMDVNAELEFSLGPELSSETADTLRGPFEL